MKTFFPDLRRLFKARPIGVLTLLPVLLAWGCYSAEFYPVSGYHGLRGSGKESAEVRFSPPRRTYTELGVLIVRNYAGDLRDETFLAFLRGKIREHGARGGWIQDRRYHRQVHYQTESVSARRPGGASIPGGEIAGQVAVIRVVLYKYDREGPNQPAAE